jgi:chromosome segregation ATPase
LVEQYKTISKNVDAILNSQEKYRDKLYELEKSEVALENLIRNFEQFRGQFDTLISSKSFPLPGCHNNYDALISEIEKVKANIREEVKSINDHASKKWDAQHTSNADQEKRIQKIEDLISFIQYILAPIYGVLISIILYKIF